MPRSDGAAGAAPARTGGVARPGAPAAPTNRAAPTTAAGAAKALLAAAAQAALEAARGTRRAARPAQAAGAADRLLAGDRDRRLDRRQPALLRDLGPAPVLQARGRSQGRPARQPVHPAERPEHPRHGHRRAAAEHQGTGRRAQPQVLRTAGKGRSAARALLGRRIPRRLADGDPGGRRHLQQTLDPARLLRRNPRRAAARKSTPPSPSAAPRCRSRRSKSSSTSRSTTSRSSTSPASKTWSTRSAASK